MTWENKLLAAGLLVGLLAGAVAAEPFSFVVFGDNRDG